MKLKKTKKPETKVHEFSDAEGVMLSSVEGGKRQVLRVQIRDGVLTAEAISGAEDLRLSGNRAVLVLEGIIAAPRGVKREAVI